MDDSLVSWKSKIAGYSDDDDDDDGGSCDYKIDDDGDDDLVSLNNKRDAAVVVLENDVNYGHVIYRKNIMIYLLMMIIARKVC